MDKALLVTMFLLVCVNDVYADQPSGTAMRSLDEQVQEIKSDVLEIAAELSLLEEQLLFPSNSQLAIFVALEATDDRQMRLDAVHLDINGEPATRYIYSFKELEALQHGGVQRIYTGNVARGEHALAVSVIGKAPNGEPVTRTKTFTFTKGIEPQLLGLTVAGGSADSLQLASW